MMYVHLFGCDNFTSFAPPAVGSAEAASQAACLTNGDWFQGGQTDADTMYRAATMDWDLNATGYDAAGTIAAFNSYYNAPLWTA